MAEELTEFGNKFNMKNVRKKSKLIHKFWSWMSILTMISLTKYKLQQDTVNKSKAEKDWKAFILDKLLELQVSGS